MKYTKKAPWLDYQIKLSSVFDDFLNSTIKDLIEKSGNARRADAFKGMETALSVIIANLLTQHAVHPEIGLRVDLSNDGYPKGPFNPHELGIRAVRSVIDYLDTHEPSLIYKKGGNLDRISGNGHVTQIWGSDPLIDELVKYSDRKLERSSSNIDMNQPITRNVYDYKEYMTTYDDMIMKTGIPSIRLRESSSKEHGKFISFKSTNETYSMEKILYQINIFIERNNFCNIFVEDKEFDRLCNEHYKNTSSFEDFDSTPETLDLISKRTLYRVFNDGTFEHGGRFYGGWWQNIPSNYRRFITINGLPTVETDYSSMQLAMLYAKIGQQLNGDAYAIDGIDPRFRLLIKTTTLQLINGKGHIKAPPKTCLPENMTWNELQQAVRERHASIAKYFGSGEGIRLQRQDSDIAETILMEMMGKGILALPVHDSFIVAEGHGDSLRETMLNSYQRTMGGKSIQLKQAPALLDDLIPDQGNLTAIKRHSLGMKLFQAKREGPAYKGYRQREEILNSIRQNGSKPANLPEALQYGVTASNPDVTPTGPRERIKQLGRWIESKPMIRLWDRFQAR